MSSPSVEPESLVETFGELLGGDKLKHATSLARKLRRVNVDAEAVICQAGATSDSLHLIRGGTFRVSVGSGTHRRELARLGAGDWFGELGMVSPSPGTAEVQALDAGEVLELTHDAFMELTTEDPVLARAILHRFDQVLLERILNARNVDTTPETGGSYLARLFGALFGKGNAS